jgi:hypothetical protein
MSLTTRIAVMRYGIVPLAGASAVTLALLLFDVTHPARAAEALLRSLVYACSITGLAAATLPRLGFACGRAGTWRLVLRAVLTVSTLFACAVVGTFVGGVVLLLLGLDTGTGFWAAFGFSVRIGVLVTFTLGLATVGYEAFRDRLRRMDRLKQFFSAPLAELIVSGQGDDPLRSRRREVSTTPRWGRWFSSGTPRWNASPAMG